MVQEQIEKAYRLYEQHSESLLKDRGFADLLERYGRAVLRTFDFMRGHGMVAACARCAVEPRRSCCFQEVEDWYDDILLLINLLMGVELHDLGETPGECFFLGSQGCKLKARHSFCVNYLCPALNDALGPALSKAFNAEAGKELSMGWELERLIRKGLGRRS
jgi:hypothetical protein